MGYFEVGLLVGLLVYLLFIILLKKNEEFREFFYKEMLQDTILGEAGTVLLYPNESNEELTSAQRIFVVSTFIALHILVALLLLIVFLVIGYVLAPFIIIGAIIGPIIYKNNKKKVAQKAEEYQEARDAKEEEYKNS